MGACESKHNNLISRKKEHKDLESPYLYLNEPGKSQEEKKFEIQPEILEFNKDAFLQNYKLEREVLGVGTFGEVRKAYHKPSGAHRAVKMIYISRFSEKDNNKIQKEVTIMMKLDHPNIVKIYESFIDKKIFYIIMELATGGELFTKIDEKKFFSEKEAAEITYQLFSAINYLHKNNIVHRDIKPENIVLDDKFLKLVDFGTSQEFKKGNLFNQVEGTPYYIAPEVLSGSYNEKCDIWSAGVILYILLSGTPPFNGKNDDEIFSNVLKAKPAYTKEIVKQASVQAVDLLKKILLKDPQARLSAEEVLNHEWFRVFNSKNYELGVDVLHNIKKFNFKSKFEQNVYMFFANNIISKKEKDDLTETFKKLDKNNDGVITKDELLDGYKSSNLVISPIDMDKLILNLDEKKTGSINYSDFIIASWDRKMDLTEKQIEECFKMLDQNKDGRITLDEIRSIFQTKKYPINKEWLDAFDSYDKNNDKALSFEEFKILLKNIIAS